MKLKKKYSMCLLANLLVFTVASAFLALPVTAPVTKITWLTHWTEPDEGFYWGNVTAEYTKLTGVTIEMYTIDFEGLHDEINNRYLGKQDTDMIHMHGMWITEMANWKKPCLAEPSDLVQADIRANWADQAVKGSTWKNITWGYPSEYNSWALVYNRKLFNDKIADPKTSLDDKTFLQGVLNKLETDVPLTWDLGATSEFVRAAKLLTEWNATPTGDVIWKSGFSPFIEGMSEEQRYQFLSMLWSNGGDYLNLTRPAPLFNSTNGEQVMQLYYNLGFVYDTYDPLASLDYWFGAWTPEQQTIAMIIFPTWMTGVRNAAGDAFANLGIAPIPIGPSGSASVSAVYNWLNVVTQKAVDKKDGSAEAAWAFLDWINEPRAAGSIKLPGAPDIGDVPRGDQVSIMGDYLIYDSILPTRKTDQVNGRVWDRRAAGHVGKLLKDDHWFRGFNDTANLYGHPDVPFVKATEVQYEIGTMFEKVVTLGATPVVDVVEAAASDISKILPVTGDIDLNGIVDLFDAVILVKDYDAVPGYKWTRGRSDCTDDGYAGLEDAIIIMQNYGRTWTP